MNRICIFSVLVIMLSACNAGGNYIEKEKGIYEITQVEAKKKHTKKISYVFLFRIYITTFI